MYHRSSVVIPLHFVWATYQRMPLISPEICEALYRCICQEAECLGCEVLGIGGMPDHVHLAILLPSTVTVFQVAKQTKGVSSRFAEKELLLPDSFFKWQEGYAAYAFHRSLISRVVAYINNQERHHAENNIWPDLEKTREELPEVPSKQPRPKDDWRSP